MRQSSLIWFQSFFIQKRWSFYEKLNEIDEKDVVNYYFNRKPEKAEKKRSETNENSKK